jgi:transposase
LTWALETGTPERFASIKAAMSYCGLTSALRESAGQQKRGPLSKQRNRHLQSVLIEAAKMAPMLNDKLKEVHTKAKEKGGHRNRATLAVARKLVAYLLAADRAFLAQQGERVAA